MKIKFLIVFVIIVSFSFLILKFEHNQKIDEYLQQKTVHYEIMYKSIYSQFKQNSELIYEYILKKNQIVEIYKKLQITSNLEELNKLRQELYLLNEKDYEYFKQLKLKQLHFHLSNNESFLRMHEPLKHSDNLTKFRETVAYVNRTKTKIDGYESGRIYSGFRFVYPIKDKENKHLGSVEVSFDISAFTSKFMEYYKVLCNFHINKKIVDKKVFNEFKSKYHTKSPFVDYYLENCTLTEIKKFKSDFVLSKAKMRNTEAKAKGLKSIEQNKAISSFDNIINKVITFIPMTNPVTNEVNAFLTIRTDAKYINDKRLNFYFIFTLITIFTIIILYLIYRIITSKENLNVVLKDMVIGQTKKLSTLNKNLEETVKERTQELELSQNNMTTYINLIDKNIITSSTDLFGNITEVSQAFCDITGYSKEELIGKAHSIIRHPDNSSKMYEQLWENCHNDKVWIGEIKNLKKNKEFYWVNASIHPIYDNYNKKIGYTAIRQNITNQKLIEEISITDGLTGIYNRRHFSKQFPSVINSAKRHDKLVCFVIIDIDYFKQYNDTYGHQMGDDVLIKFASTIGKSLHRADDSCYRLGGEEFGIIFKSETREQALILVNKIKQNIEDLKIEHKKSSVSSYITASFGLVCKNANNIKDADVIYKEADDLLYEAKNNGRNRISINK